MHTGGVMRFHHRHLLKAEPTSPPPPPPPNTAGSKGSYLSESDFETNMVVILVALLCALVVVLGLNLLVRRTLRSRSEEEVEAQLATATASTGLKKQVLRQLPVVIYCPGANISATECPICLGEFVEGEKIRVLPKCNHRFHVRCIDTWLVSHPSCPNCRHPLLDPPSTQVNTTNLL